MNRHLRNPFERLKDIHYYQEQRYSLRISTEPGQLWTAEILTPWGPLRLWTLAKCAIDENMELRSALSGMLNTCVRDPADPVDLDGVDGYVDVPLGYRVMKLLTIFDAELARL
jgi:hypothetical protein